MSDPTSGPSGGSPRPAVSGWDELVTAALLGTSRRPLPGALPAPVARLAAAQDDAGLALLDAAAGYAAYLHAGRRPGTAPAPAPAPRQRLDFAPEPAQELLAELLRGPHPGLVDEWLRTCAARGLAARPRLWPALARAAVATNAPDRSAVRAVLGERGLAFAAQHPRWRSLAVGSTAGPASGPGLPSAAGSPGKAPASGGETDLSAGRAAWSADATALALAAFRTTHRSGRLRVEVHPPAGHDLLRAVADSELGAWERSTGLDPVELLGLLRAAVGERFPDLVGAFTRAVVAQQDQVWACALLPHTGAPTDLLGALPGPWLEFLARTALARLVSGGLAVPTARRLARLLGYRAPPGMLADLERLAGPGVPGARLAASGPAGPPGLAEAAQVLAGRLHIQQTFAPTGSEETP